MTDLDEVIIDFDGKRESSLVKHIEGCQLLSSTEKILLNKAYKEASKFKPWNFRGINIRKNNAKLLLKKNYSFCDKANLVMAYAIAYKWL